MRNNNRTYAWRRPDAAGGRERGCPQRETTGTWACCAVRGKARAVWARFESPALQILLLTRVTPALPTPALHDPGDHAQTAVAVAADTKPGARSGRAMPTRAVRQLVAVDPNAGSGGDADMADAVQPLVFVVPKAAQEASVFPGAVSVEFTPGQGGRGNKSRTGGAAAAAAKAAKLTVPVSPLLSTAQRAGATTRSRTAGLAHEPGAVDGGAISPFVPLAERLFKMETRTPPRFKAPPPPPGAPAVAATPRLTRAASPKFATAQRLRGAKAKSSAQMEAEFLASVQPFKALPLSSGISDHAMAPPPVAMHSSHSLKNVTQPQPFVLATERRSHRKSRIAAAAAEEEEMAGTSRKLPMTTPTKTGRPTQAVSPLLATARRARRHVASHEAAPAMTPSFKARPVPCSLTQPWAPDPHSASVKPLTAAEPFELATERRGQAYMRQLAARLAAQEAQAEDQRHVRSRPPPPGMVVPVAPSGAAGALPGDGIHAAAVAALQKRRQETEQLLKAQAVGFKARKPPAMAQPFVPAISDAELTKPQDPALASDARAARRAAFDAANEGRLRAQEAAAAAAAAAEQARQAAELARARATELVPKARPMPDFSYKPPPTASKRPLTEPLSPTLGIKRRRW